MAALREIQLDVMQALFGRAPAAAPAGAAASMASMASMESTTAIAAERHVRPGVLAPARRLEVYRHNVTASLSAALAAVYPTVAELVGEDFFAFAARHYIHEHPPRSGNLHDYGALLPPFLARFEPVAGLPYLPDVARLEWAWHHVFHTEPAPAADAMQALADIAATPEARRGGLCFDWQPAAELVCSAHPVLSLWRWHQLPAAQRGEPQWPQRAEAAVVVQADGRVGVHALAPAECTLLAALRRGATLARAASAAFRADAGFDLAAALGRHLVLGVLLHPQPRA